MTYIRKKCDKSLNGGVDTATKKAVYLYLWLWNRPISKRRRL